MAQKQSEKGSAAKGTPRLRGGFIVPQAKHMPTLFSFIIWWALAAMSVTVLIPFFVNQHGDSYWTDGQTILFLDGDQRGLDGGTGRWPT